MFEIRYMTFGTWYVHPQRFKSFTAAEREVRWLDNHGYVERVQIREV